VIIFRLLSRGSSKGWQENEMIDETGLEDGMKSDIRISWKISGICWFMISCLKTQGRYFGFF
jgi:hypothetical protein